MKNKLTYFLILCGCLFSQNPYNLETYESSINPSTTINFSIDKIYKVILEVYYVNSRYIRILVDKYINQSSHSILWDTKDLYSGINIIKMRVGDRIHTQKVVLVK